MKKKVKRKMEEEDYGSDLDLDKELYPIGHYIKDRSELVKQMFASLKRAKVKSMLPDILKVFLHLYYCVLFTSIVLTIKTHCVLKMQIFGFYVCQR